ncbi:MAG TPA: nucleoside deaminase [Ignavibacteria bacterium]
MAEFNTEFLREAIRLSKENLTDGAGGPFGAVIVKEGKIISEGRNAVLATKDPTAHAEIQAIRNASKHLNDFNLKGCEIYTNCEPCPMCLSAIYWARLDKIYYANTKQDAAAIGFDDEFIYKELALPEVQRKIEMIHINNEDARKIFLEWFGSETKILY